LTDLTAETRNALPLFSSSLISFCITFISVNGSECCETASAIVLYLSLNVARSDVCWRAHPSGTFITKPSRERYSRKTWLSGMSPGGFFSGAIGCSRNGSGWSAVCANRCADVNAMRVTNAVVTSRAPVLFIVASK